MKISYVKSSLQYWQPLISSIRFYGSDCLPQPFPKQQILDSSKLKEFADDNFKLNENGGKCYKQVENTVGKWEIARNEQFSPLSYSVFQRLILQTRKNQGLFWTELNSIP